MNFRDAIRAAGHRVFEEEIGHEEVVKFIGENGLEKTPAIINVEGKKVATNFLATRELLCGYMDICVSDLAKYLANLKIGGRIVERDVDYVELDSLEDLPVPKYFENDAGRYITAGIIVTGNGNDYGSYNASFHRMLILGKKKMAVRLVPPRHTYLRWKSAIDRDEELEIAISISPHPLFMFASATRVDEGMEYHYASSLMKTLEVSNVDGIHVPESEIVIRGRITGEMVDEGPFIDITGTYDRIRRAPVIEVDTIYAKEDFMFYSITPAGYEHQMLMGVPYEPEIYRAVARVCRVKNVIMTAGGRHYLHAIVQIEKITDGDGKNAILAAFSAHPSLKHVVVVDDDIDIYSMEDVEYAIATRFQADRDLVVITNARGSSLDPSAKDNITAKLGIDATFKGDKKKYEKIY
ncbi:UbiD family decarboxylase [Geoglobus acetivorans]|uniref:Anhydromevalonate phosphate decarboxylase n=1 Tax=Geoglobus acetivorans TaxID=565033 RepID=A0A0A7GJ00_GEOAI|nr:UbiD family decarboxylase [Geoglobus acetivorans]